MQTNQHSASILIWSIFLSLILSISFISISDKISNNIISNQGFIDKSNRDNIIETKLKNKDYSDIFLSKSKENIIFTQNKDYKGSLYKGENIKIKFEQISDISINIVEGGPISYITHGDLTLSGIITSNNSINNLSGSIILTNLAGYTTFNINSNAILIAPTTRYKIIKTIGNKDVIKTRGIIYNN